MNYDVHQNYYFDFNLSNTMLVCILDLYNCIYYAMSQSFVQDYFGLTIVDWVNK